MKYLLFVLLVVTAISLITVKDNSLGCLLGTEEKCCLNIDNSNLLSLMFSAICLEDSANSLCLIKRQSLFRIFQ